MNHYEALEVSPGASPEVIRAAYRSLMQRFHPDKNPGDASVAARAAALTQAYDVLSDAARRAEYDMRLQAAATPAGQGEQFGRASPARGYAAPNRTHSGSRSVRQDGPKPGFGMWWLLLIALAAAVGVFASVKMKGADPRKELASIRQGFASAGITEAQRRQLYARKLQILERNPELLRAASDEKSQDMAARTFQLLDSPLTVTVGEGRAMTGGTAGELKIRRLSLLLGTFDAPELIAVMTRHRERLIRDLSARLAGEDAQGLNAAGGEGRLKHVVREAVTATLRIDAGAEYPSTYFESPGRYGVVDVVLPDRYEVQLRSLR